MFPSRLGPIGQVCSLLLSCAPACGSDAAPIPNASRPHIAPQALHLPEGIEAVDVGKLLATAKRPDSRGTVVNIWASWCGSCRQEVPMLVKLRTDLMRKGLALLFVSADEPQDFPKVRESLRGWGLPLPALVVAPGTLGNFKRALSADWHGGIPATFLIDAQGKLRHLWEGPILEEEISPVLQRYLAGEPVDGVTRTAAQPG